jgi:hypothetical protein
MTNIVFPMNQTQYILDFLSASRSREHWNLPNTEIFKSKDAASVYSRKTLVIKIAIKEGFSKDFTKLKPFSKVKNTSID